MAAEAPSGAKKENKKPEPPVLAPVAFKSGKSLPAIIDVPKTSSAYDFPQLGGGLGKAAPGMNQKQDLANKANAMFDDLDNDNDDFDESEQQSEQKSKVGASGIDLDFEQGSDESGDGNFNANELLNLTDYQNKRSQKLPEKEKTLG